ncbi:MAG: squalene/phytoene synthase family protein [Bacteroidetes bacterium]|nr:squalene/phytoene synthase family protein [Bacteroidota bacterium]
MKELFDTVSVKCSKLTTTSYSTSFSLGIKLLDKQFREPIYSIYGFVRFADEIVDTFHDYDKQYLLDKFRKDTMEAIEQKISLNPILNSFQKVVHQFDIDMQLITTFLDSMEMDLNKKEYDKALYDKYILGSAEVVGLMCLKIFTNGNRDLYNQLEYYAMKLGAAFQKINFLRDLQADYHVMGRTYFPGINFETFNETEKVKIERDIEADFSMGYEGIKQLPKNSRFGVYIAYVYYYALFKKIKNTPAHRIMNERIRVPDNEKYSLLLRSYVKHSLNMI